MCLVDFFFNLIFYQSNLTHQLTTETIFLIYKLFINNYTIII